MLRLWQGLVKIITRWCEGCQFCPGCVMIMWRFCQGFGQGYVKIIYTKVMAKLLQGLVKVRSRLWQVYANVQWRFGIIWLKWSQTLLKDIPSWHVTTNDARTSLINYSCIHIKSWRYPLMSQPSTSPLPFTTTTTPHHPHHKPYSLHHAVHVQHFFNAAQTAPKYLTFLTWLLQTCIIFHKHVRFYVASQCTQFDYFYDFTTKVRTFIYLIKMYLLFHLEMGRKYVQPNNGYIEHHILYSLQSLFQ